MLSLSSLQTRLTNALHKVKTAMCVAWSSLLGMISNANTRFKWRETNQSKSGMGNKNAWQHCVARSWFHGQNRIHHVVEKQNCHKEFLFFSCALPMQGTALTLRWASVRAPSSNSFRNLDASCHFEYFSNNLFTHKNTKAPSLFARRCTSPCLFLFPCTLATVGATKRDTILPGLVLSLFHPSPEIIFWMKGMHLYKSDLQGERIYFFICAHPSCSFR